MVKKKVAKKQAKGRRSNKKGKIVLQLSRKGAAGWFGIFCFVYICIFLLGVIMGRGLAPAKLAPDELQAELAALRESVLKEKQGAISKDTEVLAKSTDFVFPAAVKQAPSKKGSASGKWQKTQAVPHKTRKVLKPKKAVRTASKAGNAGKSAGSRHAIQVASLKDKRVADQMVKRLREKGYNAFHVKTRVSGNDIRYRVRVGHFAGKKEASRMLSKLRKEYQGAILVAP